MAPLSKQLSGVILEHDHFGSHLNDKGKTMDPAKEKRNFKYAGNAIASIWENLELDGPPIIAEYVDTEASEVFVVEEQTAEWRRDHVRESHYFLQVSFR